MLDAPARPTSAAPALGAALGAGVLVALQSRVNGALGLQVGSAVLAATVSFATGLLLVATAVLLRPAARARLPLLRDAPWWTLLGGLGGAALVAVAATAAPVLGVALLTLGIVAGQTAGALLVDRLGLGPGGPRPLSPPRVAGAALCLVAVALAGPADGGTPAPLLLAATVVVGAVISVQQALNGRVRARTGDASVATLVNFAVGTTALLLAVAAGLGGQGLGGAVGADWPGAWWLYVGGPIGVLFIGVAAAVVSRLGVLRLGLASVAGQVSGALVVDALLPLADAALTPLTVLGAVLTVAAVAVAGRGAR